MNDLTNLNSILFKQLEALDNPDLTDEEFEKQVTNDVIMFLDGDKTNFDISNLVKMSRTDLVRFNQQGIKSNNKDVTLAAVYMAKIKARRKRKSKEDSK